MLLREKRKQEANEARWKAEAEAEEAKWEEVAVQEAAEEDANDKEIDDSVQRSSVVVPPFEASAPPDPVIEEQTFEETGEFNARATSSSMQ